jgi:hypothetical protein
MNAANDAVSLKRFAATRWSLVAAAEATDALTARRALVELCHRYWYPVFAYMRGCGHGADVAQDITRGFFEHLLRGGLTVTEAQAHGRFREYLLERLHHFLGDDWKQAADGREPDLAQPMSAADLEARYQRDASRGLTPEQAYQRSYALEILASALGRLRREAEHAGRQAMFDALQPWLSSEPAPGEMDAVARELAIRPLAAVVALRRLRQRFRELAEAELSESVTTADDLQAERDALARALGQG